MENILWDDVVFKLRQTRLKLALSLTPLGAVRAAAEGTGYKNRRLGKSRGVRFDSRLVQSVRCDTLWAWKGSLSVPALTSLGTLTLSLFCMHRSGCSYCDASGEWVCLPSLRLESESTALLRVSIKKKKKGQCRRTTVSSSKRTFANPSKFLWTLRSTDWKWTAVDRRRGITAAEGHGASKSTGWTRQRWTKSPRLRQLAELKETKKKNQELVPARLGAVKLHFRCCRNILDLFVNKHALITVASVGLVTRLWLCLTVSPARSTHDHCTWQASRTTCDSDVMEKPSRRWRGAVQQLADVVWES